MPETDYAKILKKAGFGNPNNSEFEEAKKSETGDFFSNCNYIMEELNRIVSRRNYLITNPGKKSLRNIRLLEIEFCQEDRNFNQLVQKYNQLPETYKGSLWEYYNLAFEKERDLIDLLSDLTIDMPGDI